MSDEGMWGEGRGEGVWLNCLPHLQVSLEEAMAYLDNEESVDLPVFSEKVWSFVLDKITFEPPATEPVETTPPPTESPPPDDTAEKDFDDYDYGE